MRYNKLILLIVAAVILFSSCNRNIGAIVPDYERFDGIVPQNTSITAAHNLRSGSLPAYVLLVSEFNRTNKYNIKVDLAAYTEPLTLAADLAIVKPTEAAALLRKGLSIDLSPLISHPVWGMDDGRKRFYRAARKQTEYWFFARRITAIPLMMDARILIVNNDLLNATGFDEFPRSWFMTNELLNKAGKNQKHILGMENIPDELISIINARGGSILRSTGFSYSINNPVVNRTLRYLRKLEEKKILSINRTKYLNQTGFAFGRLLAVYTDTDGIKPYADLISMVNPELDWGIALLPTRIPGNGITVNCSQSAVVLAGSTNAQIASWLFIKWLSEPQQQKRLAADTYSIPVVREVIPSIISDGAEGWVPQWLSAAKLVDNSRMDLIPELFDYNEVSEQITQMLHRIDSGAWVWLETMKLDMKIKKDRRDDKGNEAGNKI